MTQTDEYQGLLQRLRRLISGDDQTYFAMDGAEMALLVPLMPHLQVREPQEPSVAKP